MKLLRIVLSDLHLGTGIRPGEPNAFEDFHHDDALADLLAYYDREVGDGELELVLNGDIFDLLKVKIGGKWPVEITDEVATEKLRQCLDGHPRVVSALRALLSRRDRRIVYLPGNHDLDMWLPGPQELFRRYVAPGAAATRVHFITTSDAYYLPEGIQIRHGHQFERIHRVDYRRMTRTLRDGREILDLPWGSLWILDVMNPAKEMRSYVDRIQPLGRFLMGSLVFDTFFVLSFFWHSALYFLRRRVFDIGRWIDRLRRLPAMVREDIFALAGGFDEAVHRELRKLRGAWCLVVGHSHGPRYQQFPGGKILVNTGTWMKMINLDVQHLGQDSGLTYCTIAYEYEGRPRVSLLRWFGPSKPYEVIPHAD